MIKRKSLQIIQNIAFAVYLVSGKIGLFKYGFFESRFIDLYYWYKSKLENIDLTLISSQINKNSTVIDIGANIGWFTVNIAKYLDEDSSIISVEPNKTNLKRLAYSLKKYKLESKVQVVPCALSDTKGLGYLNLDSKNPANHQIGTITTNSEVVQLDLLDNLVKDISDLSLIKIDVQGHESEVLQGGKQTLIKFQPAVIIEIDNRIDSKKTSQIWELMQELNYAFYIINGNLSEISKRELCVRKGYFDCVCIHRSKIF